MVQNQNKQVSSATNRAGWSLASLLLAGVAAGTPAYASLTIDPTFDPSIASATGAEGAINAAISSVEANINLAPQHHRPYLLHQGQRAGHKLDRLRFRELLQLLQRV